MFLARLLFLSCLFSCALSATLLAQCSNLTVSAPSVTNISCAGNDGAIGLNILASAAACSSTAVRLNEVMVQPNVSDGRGPTTGEYIELIAPAGTNLSCYSITDGDWVITFPAGSIVDADGIFTIGFDVNYGAGTFDLNLQNCNCSVLRSAGNNDLLVLTNTGEYLALFDNTGTFIDGVVFGSPSSGGQNRPEEGRRSDLPSGMGCNYNVITLPALNEFHSVTTPSVENTSYARLPDGNGTWATQQGGSLNQCNANGTANYNIIWSTGDTTETITGLAAGTYSVTITDATGCSVTDNFILSPNVPAVLSYVSVDASCATDNGSIDLTVINGNTPYSFAWSNGATTEDLTGLAPGNYTVTVTTSTGCQTMQDITIGATGGVTANAVTTNISCNGEQDGTITLNITDGTASSFLWSNGETTQNISGLAAGNYVVTITSASNCPTIVIAQVIEPSPLVVTTNVINANIDCSLLPTGHVSFDVSGGFSPYTYNWPNGGNASSYDNLAAGNYLVTITDNSGCSAFEGFVITAPEVILANATFTDGSERFEGELNTDATITTPADTNATYVWTVINGDANNITLGTPNANETTVSASQGGEYTLQITVTSPDGCTTTDTVVFLVGEDFLGFPTAFSPNGDGENDLFRPIQLNPSFIKEFIIYNRWGQVMYDDANLSDGGWNGQLNGKDQPRDVYIYVITYDIPTVGEKQERGSVLLVR